MNEGKTAQVICDNCGDITTADDLLPPDQAFGYIEKAEEDFCYDDVFIDDDAKVEKVDGGAWVQARIWVDDREEEH